MTAAAIKEEFGILTSLNTQIKSTQGKQVIWFNVDKEPSQISTHSPTRWEVVKKVGMGNIATDATLDCNRQGELHVPLSRGLVVPFFSFHEDIDPEDPFYGIRNIVPEESAATATMNVEGLNRNLAKFVMFTGDAANLGNFDIKPQHVKDIITGIYTSFSSVLFDV
ncbi:MAG: hypothetical protein ABI220_01855 [Candidatus Saccharimonadales bacterium]